MISIELTGNERLQFQYILPVQGSIKTLELTEKIWQKCQVNESDLNLISEIKFEENEIKFIKDMIKFLDENQKLNFSSLSLIRKILKGEK